MSGKTAKRRQELRGALIEAAERAISAGGLEAVRARDLAEEVGCAVGAIYNVFPNLDALVFEVNARTLRTFEAFLGEAKPSSPPRGENPAVAELVHLGLVYLQFAVEHRPRWRALFEHRMAAGSDMPAWYGDEQARLFALVEGPLRQLRPALDDDQLRLFARTLFSGVHGVVSLGLDAKLVALPASVLREEVRKFVRLLALGLLAVPPAL
jgi:AcrR family transcriptional regulator